MNTEEGMHAGWTAPTDVLARLIEVLGHLARGARGVGDLSEATRQPATTVAALLEWARALGLAEGQSEVGLTAMGEAFVESVDERPVLYQEAVAACPLLRPAGEGEPGEGEAADPEADAATPELDPTSTAGPEEAPLAEGADTASPEGVAASADEAASIDDAAHPHLSSLPPWRLRQLRALVRPALEPARYDWTDGRERQLGAVTFGLARPPFARALVEHLGDSLSSLEIDFPEDLSALVRLALAEGVDLAEHPALSNARPTSRRYGGAPLTDELLALADDELHQYLVAACPYLCLAATLMWRGAAMYGRGEFYLARDLWGLSFWRGGQPCGESVEVVEELARELGVRVAPRREGEGSPALLLELLHGADVVSNKKTRFVLRGAFARRIGRPTAADGLWGGRPLGEWLAPVASAVDRWLAAAVGPP